MTSVVRFEEWQEPTGTTAATTDSSGNVTFDNDVTVSGGATVSGDLTVTGSMTSANQGLVLVKSVTVGAGVSSVTVTDAFSADFDNYQVMVRVNTFSGGPYIQMRMGTTSTTDYWGSLEAATYLGSNSNSYNNGDSEFGFLSAGYIGTSTAFSVEIKSPHLSAKTFVHSTFVDPNPTTGARAGTYNGFLNNTTSYDDFTILVSTGTMSGGTIRVYGYGQ